MKRAFLAHTLMRKDGAAHACERNAMAPAASPRRRSGRPGNRSIERLPRPTCRPCLAGRRWSCSRRLRDRSPARCLAHCWGCPRRPTQRCSAGARRSSTAQATTPGRDEPFARSDRANAEIDAAIARMAPRHEAEPIGQRARGDGQRARSPSRPARSAPTSRSPSGAAQRAPRCPADGAPWMLANPEQFEACKRDALWGEAFDEAVRWVRADPGLGRIAMRDTEVGGVPIAQGTAVMDGTGEQQPGRRDLGQRRRRLQSLPRAPSASGFRQRTALLPGQAHRAPHDRGYPAADARGPLPAQCGFPISTPSHGTASRSVARAAASAVGVKHRELPAKKRRAALPNGDAGAWKLKNAKRGVFATSIV